jgi:cell division protein FtsA
MDQTNEYIVGVELGGAWVSCLVAAVENEELNVLGWGRQPSRGFARGELVDLEAAAACVEAAITAAEGSAFVRAQTIFVGAASSQYRGLNSRGCVPVLREDRLVTDQTRRNAIEAAERISLPNEREIVDVVPQTFTVDEMRWVENPVGMAGSRLEAEVHLATDAACYLHNVLGAVAKTHCRAEGMVFKPFAAAQAVLTKDERRLGALAIDIGGATTNIILIRDGAPRFSAVVPLGGRHLTYDIAICLNVSVEQADDIKVTRAFACRSQISPEQHRKTFEIRTTDGSIQAVSIGKVCSIIECRVEEMLSIVRKEVSRAGYGDAYHAGVVLTGGTAKTDGIAEAGRRVFGCPVRVGRPHIRSRLGQQLEDPSWATCVGILQCGLQQRRLGHADGPARRGTVHRILSRGIDWARAAF